MSLTEPATARGRIRRRAASLAAATALTVTGLVTMALPAHATDPSGALAYVANVGNNAVSVISTPSNTVTATIAVGSSPSR